jgi:6-phosphofructokinase 1
VVLTDVTVGFDTALSVATEAIDRLHSTAHSHHRIIVVELMGNKVGWLALGAGIAGGADVILIPEIPYDVESIADAIRRRSHSGKRFSIVAVAEGAVSKQDVEALRAAEQKVAKARSGAAEAKAEAELGQLEAQHVGNTMRLAKQLEGLTSLESRVTILGYVQRGGTPSAADRLLATRLGTACADFIHKGQYGVMVAARKEDTKPVPLEDVAGKLKSVPLDHPWVAAARRVGTCMGD